MIVLSLFHRCIMRGYEVVDFASMLSFASLESVITLSLCFVVVMIHVVLHLLECYRSFGSCILHVLLLFCVCRFSCVMTCIETVLLLVVKLLNFYSFLSTIVMLNFVLVVNFNELVILGQICLDLISVFAGHLFHLLL